MGTDDRVTKADSAFRTIGEVASELDVAQHVLRYWETRFPQLRPLQRAGNRRYYRPADVALARRINELLNNEGYTIRGVQQLLAAGDKSPIETEVTAPPASMTAAADDDSLMSELEAIRDDLADALADK
ncbi:MerR family transcriptional regulator [Sphingomonas sp. KC8]|uniref:MerR family transcriptional regulator n=1 Tax=Sphingomonas sp. KC8 TaxID=1030157 RepID=UPI0002489C15|nr:MerR family transcriptional regulator [Sphingomonas sp. KC8]ARS28610.1 MerR family transcriptional regulator [Sphingomonas sp. KC8]